MILQPYVENAIIHGLVHKPEVGRLKIEISQQGSKLLYVIEDNGIGRAKAAGIRKKSGLNAKPRGLMITGQRLEILRRKTKETFKMKIVDLKDEKGNPAGTRVELIISVFEM